jgi:hypothetical protein
MCGTSDAPRGRIVVAYFTRAGAPGVVVGSVRLSCAERAEGWCGGSDLLHYLIHDAQDVAVGVLEPHRLPVALHMHVAFHSRSG